MGASSSGPQSSSEAQQGEGQGNATGAVAEDAATQAAVAFKDRLVQYGKEGAKRTIVIDDQSDWFEVGAFGITCLNLWVIKPSR